MSLRRAKVVLALVFLLGAAPAQTVQQTTPGARVCVARDFGTPIPPAPSVDATWIQDPGRLAEGPDGQIYSTSPSGGKYGRGTIWRHDPATGKYEVLYHFPLADTTGSGARSGLIAATGADGRPNGTFYGSAYMGGRWGVGTIFRYTIGASKPEVLFHLRNGRMTGLVPRQCPTPTTCRYSGRQRADAIGGYPTSAPVVTLDGAVYGVSYYAGNMSTGVLYKLGEEKRGLPRSAFSTGAWLPTRTLLPSSATPGSTERGPLPLEATAAPCTAPPSAAMAPSGDRLAGCPRCCTSSRAPTAPSR